MDDAAAIAAIRACEVAEAQAVLDGNRDFLAGIWHPDYLVNAPHNQLVRGSADVLAMVEARVIAYSRFDRVTEDVIVRGDTAVAMGHEIVCPLYGPQSGQELTRRHTNIYRRRDNGSWGMIARHAHVVVGEGQSLDMPAGNA